MPFSLVLSGGGGGGCCVLLCIGNTFMFSDGNLKWISEETLETFSVFDVNVCSNVTLTHQL